MTKELMDLGTREQLGALDDQTKVQLLAFVRNRMQVISGQAQMIAGPAMEPIKGKAKMITRDAERFILELEELLDWRGNAQMTTKEK